MTTHFANSVHDFQVAYDIQGEGPALLLVHGFSNDRTMWRTHGWIDQLQATFTLITLDLRGCGESSAPPDPAAYSQTAHLADIETVLDECGVEQALYWGWSFGATIGTHVAAHTNRVRRAVIAGTPFGPLFQQEQWIKANRELADIAQAKRAGCLDELDLVEPKRHFAETHDLDLLWARRYAVESWPTIEPAELRCPSLVYTGTNDGNVVMVLRQQQAAIEAAGHQLQIFADFNHRQLVSERAQVAPVVSVFLAAPEGC